MSKKVKLSSLIQDDKNNNKHTAYGMDLLEKSVNKVGIIESITVSNDDKIISGNARHEIIGKNFTKEALVIETDGTQPIIIKRTDIESDTKQFYEASILANTTSKKNIDFDMEVIDSLAVEYDIDVVDLGVDIVNEEILEAEEDDFNGVPPKEPITVLGDLYEIGEHRLLCGDSTDSDQVAKLMNGEKADMVLSDPPYGMFLDADYSSLNWGDRKGKKYDNVIGDHDDFDPELINTFFKHFDYCKEMFLWGADYYFELLPDFKKGNYIVWDKTLESNGDAGSNSEYELCWSRQKHKRVVLHFNWFRYFGLQSQDTKTRVHPTQKPLEVNNHFIEIYSKEQDKIIDLYLGSGSTMVASHQLKRKCYGMELDPKYCDVIVSRMIKLDSTLSVKRNGVLLTNSEVLKFTENTSESK